MCRLARHLGDTTTVLSYRIHNGKSTFLQGDNSAFVIGAKELAIFSGGVLDYQSVVTVYDGGRVDSSGNGRAKTVANAAVYWTRVWNDPYRTVNGRSVVNPGLPTNGFEFPNGVPTGFPVLPNVSLVAT